MQSASLSFYRNSLRADSRGWLASITGRVELMHLVVYAAHLFRERRIGRADYASATPRFICAGVYFAPCSRRDWPAARS